MRTPRQTYPAITLRYSPDEVTGVPTWTLNVSDGDNTAVPVPVGSEAAAGIAQIVDVALPLPIELGGQPSSAERVVRAAHVQTLAAQLAGAEADLQATHVVVARVGAPEVAPVVAPARAPRTRPVVAPARAPRTRRPRVKDVTPPAPSNVGVVDVDVAPVEPPVLETASVHVDLPDFEPPQYEYIPERLPRRNHLEVPAVDQF